MKKMFKKIICFMILCGLMISISGCEFFESKMSRLKGELIGNSFDIGFYDNYGENILNVYGKKVSMETNYVKVKSKNSDGSTSTTYENSSVISITVDGSNMEQTGNTVLFVEHGLEPLVDFSLPSDISTSGGTITSVDRFINEYKNYFGTPKVAVISSQMGVPIAVYGGKDVYWEIPSDLPKTTILHIDDYALYIHRANYIILDTDMIK